MRFSAYSGRFSVRQLARLSDFLRGQTRSRKWGNHEAATNCAGLFLANDFWRLDVVSDIHGAHVMAEEGSRVCDSHFLLVVFREGIVWERSSRPCPTWEGTNLVFPLLAFGERPLDGDCLCRT